MTHPELKLLSIDGGGIRGVIPCIILEYIEKQTNFRISNLFNLVAGTSTGGIIAMGLSVPRPANMHPYSATEMLDLYRNHGKTIFSRREGDIWSWLHAKLFNKPYDSSHIESLLFEYFGDRKLDELVINTIVTTYEIEKGIPFYFSSRLAQKTKSENFRIYEIARSTSAAPTYFQPSVIKNENDNYYFIDGGVFANNPSVLAYSEGKEILKERRVYTSVKVNYRDNQKGYTPNVMADDEDLPIFLLSIGTGSFKTQIQPTEIENWRTRHWIKPLLTDVFMRSVSESTHFTMQHLLPPYKNKMPRYIRLNPPIIGAEIQMDDASDEAIDRLTTIANDYIVSERSLIDHVCKLITNSYGVI